MKPIDLTGQKFGRWLVIEKADRPDKSGQLTWKCICDCGSEGIVRGGPLRNGTSRSCGCLASEIVSERVKSSPPKRTHGHTTGRVQTAEYRIWVGIIKRCTNPKAQGYENYGGRGIAVCERWMKFENFLADMGKRPSFNHSIERRENDDGYNPDNCEWATRIQQANNKRSNKVITHDGKRKTLQQLANEFGINRSTLQSRLDSGMELNHALTATVKLGNNQTTFKKEEK